VPPREVTRRIETTQKRVKELEKKIEELQLKGSSATNGASAQNIREVNGIKVMVHQVEHADAKLLRGLADRYRDQLQSGVVAIGGPTEDGKALVLVAATKDLVAKGLHAGNLVREMAQIIGGSGGGKPDMAQAGGTLPAHLPQAFEKLYELVKV
jgi:alanyl-tRNA synthetase